MTLSNILKNWSITAKLLATMSLKQLLSIIWACVWSGKKVSHIEMMMKT